MADANRLIMYFLQPGSGGLPRGIAAAHPSGYPSLRDGVLALDPLGFPVQMDIEGALSWPDCEVGIDPFYNYPSTLEVTAGSYPFEIESYLDGLVDDGTNINIPVQNLNSSYYNPVIVPGTGRYLRAKAFISALVESGNIQTWPDETQTELPFRNFLTDRRMVYDFSVGSIMLVFKKDGSQSVKRVWSASVSGYRRILWRQRVEQLVGGVWQVYIPDRDRYRYYPFSFQFDYEMADGDPANMSPVGDFETVVFTSPNMDGKWSTSGTSFEVVSVTLP
jgi:hypothetical protein